jgi:hypothetical protein
MDSDEVILVIGTSPWTRSSLECDQQTLSAWGGPPRLTRDCKCKMVNCCAVIAFAYI